MVHSTLNETDELLFEIDKFDIFNNEQQLSKKDIIDLADVEYDWSVGECDNVRFDVIESVKDFFEKCNNELPKLQEPLVFIVNRATDGVQWVTLVIVHQDRQLFCYYVDPLGDSIDKGIKQYLDGKQIHCPEIDVGTTNPNTGIFALKSLEAIFKSESKCDKILLQPKPSFSVRMGNAVKTIKIKDADKRKKELNSLIDKDSRYVRVHIDKLSQALAGNRLDWKKDRACVRTFLIFSDLSTNHVRAMLTVGSRDEQIAASYVATHNGDTSEMEKLLRIENITLIFIKDDISEAFPDIADDLSILECARRITEFYKYLDNVATVEKNLDSISDEIVDAASRLKARKKIEEKLNWCKLAIEKPEGDKPNRGFLPRFNNLILFLESVALEDKEISDALNEKLKRIKKRITNDDDSQIITVLRSHQILHRSKEYANVIINPRFITNYISTEKRTELYEKMVSYLDQTIMKLNRNDIHSKKICIDSFLKTKAEIDSIEYSAKDKKTVDDYVCAQFRSFLRINPVTFKDSPLRTFQLIVNVIPLLHCLGYFYQSGNRNDGVIDELEMNELKIIRRERNNFVHNFHKYPSERARQYELQKFLSTAKLTFFKYLFSQKVNKNIFSPESTIHTIESELLKKLDQIFSESESEKIIAANDNKNGEHFELITKKLEPTSTSDSPFANFIENYLQIMHLIDNDSMNEERKRKYPEKPHRYDSLSAEKRLKIYDQFTIVKNLYTSRNNEYTNKRLGLQRVMEKFGISQLVFDSIVDIFVKNKIDMRAENKNADVFVKKVGEDIRILSQIKREYKNPIREIIELYEDRENLTGKRTSIRAKMHSIPKGKALIVNRVKIDTDSFVCNILQMFCHISGQGKQIFKSVKNAFDDSAFLSFLCHNEIKFPKEYLEIPCLYPCIVHLLKSDKIIDLTPSDLHRMIDYFLEDDTNQLHLLKILELKENILVKIFTSHDISLENVKTKIYNEFSSRINENNIDNVLPMIKYENHAEGILNGICSHANANDDKSIKLLKKTLDVLDKACDELWNAREYDKLNGIIHIAAIDSIISDLSEKDSADLSALGIYRRRAAIYNKYRLHDKANELLVLIRNTVESAPEKNISTQCFLFLACADLAYTKHMEKKYEEAYDELKNLYITIIGASLQRSNIYYSYKLSDGHYEEIKNTKNYKTIREWHPKYLDIIKIRRDMAFQLIRLAQSIERESSSKALENYQKSLEIYKEVLALKGDLTKGPDIVKSIRDVAYVSRLLADQRLFIHERTKRRMNKLEVDNIVKLYREAHRLYTKIYEILRRELWETHPSIMKTTENLFFLRRKIANCYNELGRITLAKELKKKINTKEPLDHHEMALYLNNNIYQFRKKYWAINHKYVLNAMNDLSKTNYYLATLYFHNHDDPRLARKHNKANLELLKELAKQEFGKSKKHLQNAVQFESDLKACGRRGVS